MDKKDLIKEFSSLSESGFIPTNPGFQHSPGQPFGCSHLFQRVASFLPRMFHLLPERLGRLFSSLSESGFIPTRVPLGFRDSGVGVRFSSLSESGFIPTLKLKTHCQSTITSGFSSLSESGFIPTGY